VSLNSDNIEELVSAVKEAKFLRGHLKTE